MRYVLADEIGKRLVTLLKEGKSCEGQESFCKAMELTKAYASSGSVMNYNAVPKLFYDLFEMFETGEDPRKK